MLNMLNMLKMKKIIAFLITAAIVTLTASTAMLSSVFAENHHMAIVADVCGYFSDKDKQEILLSAQTFANDSGFNVVILISDNVGSNKSDRAVVDYADVYYETLCGKNTDGILLLINLDTKYDYISTSGVCINYYSDRRIDSMFDWFYGDLKAERYKDAALHFVNSADYYYRQGKDNHQVEIAGREVELEEAFVTFAFLLFFAMVVGFVIYAVNRKKHTIQKPLNNWYVVKGSLLFSQATDTYLGTQTTRIYSPQSSGGGGSHGGGGHSSTHHSSGGGRHGGGGRHR